MPGIVLPETTLCAIVKDEMMNPAGGIVRFVDSHLPYVEEGVIVDTGSGDGTREALENLQAKYSHLKIYDQQFEGFGQSRNYSLGRVRTKRALILDADERLTQEDFSTLEKFMYKNQAQAYSFDFLNIFPNGVECLPKREDVLNPRILEVRYPGTRFNGDVGEYLTVDGKEMWEMPGFSRLCAEVYIKHFLPSEDALREKNIARYRYPAREGAFPYSQVPANWKVHNPQEVRFR